MRGKTREGGVAFNIGFGVATYACVRLFVGS